MTKDRLINLALLMASLMATRPRDGGVCGSEIAASAVATLAPGRSSYSGMVPAVCRAE